MARLLRFQRLTMRDALILTYIDICGICATLLDWVCAMEHGKDHFGKVSKAMTRWAQCTEVIRVVIAVIIVNMVNIKLYWM